MTSHRPRPHCLDVPSWRKFTREEHLEYVEKLQDRKSPKGAKGDALSVRQRLSTLDMYCYLRARFETPNGIQNILRRDDSDNLIHWDFKISICEADVYIMATSREVQFMIAEPMTDEDWKALILGIKADFARVGPEKKTILDGLEKWTLFPNKYVAIAGLCADHHAVITDVLAGGDPFAFDERAEPDKARATPSPDAALYGACLQLALLTPIMAEAFINMVILVLCRPEVRDDKRRYDAFVREQIDLKIADLSYKCQGFSKTVDMKTDVAKAFKRVMDKRNNSIHGNIDPAREGIRSMVALKPDRASAWPSSRRPKGSSCTFSCCSVPYEKRRIEGWSTGRASSFSLALYSVIYSVSLWTASGNAGVKIRIDMTGERYGRLYGVAFAETRRGHAHWLFQCDCGQTTIANGARVRAGKTLSCGCLQREVCAARLTVHGHRAQKRHGPTYRAWQQINTYCSNPASARFKDFGAKGIAVAAAWTADFEVFLADMGERPAGAVLERPDKAGDFTRDNCVWVAVRSRSERALEGHRARRAADKSKSGWFVQEAETPMEYRRAS